MKSKKTTFLMLGCIIFFTGCVEEGVAPTETPTSTIIPEQTVSTSTPTPTPTSTPEAVWEPEVTIKPGYKLYQDDEFGYGFVYPENWEQGDFGIGDDQESGVIFGSDTLDSNGLPIASFSLVAYSDSTSVKFWETPSFIEHGGLDYAIEIGMIYEFEDITINGRDGFEIIHNPFWKGPGERKVRMVILTVDDLSYVAIVFASDGTLEGDLYDEYESTFDDIINSLIFK